MPDPLSHFWCHNCGYMRYCTTPDYQPGYSPCPRLCDLPVRGYQDSAGKQPRQACESDTTFFPLPIIEQDVKISFADGMPILNLSIQSILGKAPHPAQITDLISAFIAFYRLPDFFQESISLLLFLRTSSKALSVTIGVSPYIRNGFLLGTNTQCQLPCQSRMEATRSSFSLLGS